MVTSSSGAYALNHACSIQNGMKVEMAKFHQKSEIAQRRSQY